jgi:glycosyltransferase involved in cell wall biosynthesis
MINIAYLVSTLSNTGPTNQLYNIISHLDRQQFNPYIITLSSEGKDSKIQDFHKLELPIITLGLSRLQGFFRSRKKLIELLKSKSIDLIHSQGWRPDMLSSKLEYPTICTIRNIAYQDYPMKYGNLIGNIMSFTHLSALKNIDIKVACSHFIGDELTKFKGIDITVIQNGINRSKYYPVTQNEKEKLRNKLGIPLNKVVFIVTGSLIKRKNTDFLIDAFEGFQSDIQLYIVGDGPLKGHFEKRKSKNIHLVGKVDTVTSYLQASDAFCSSSLSEGLPNTVLEALSCNLPLLISDIKPHEEIFRECENPTEIGYIFENNNLKDLREKIELMVARLTSKEFNTNNSASELSAKFDSKINSISYQKLYLKLKSKI